MTLPTVADLLDRSWAPPAWPKGYACIYKATLIETGQGYVGKAVDLRKRFRSHMYQDEYFDRALRKHGPENFTIEILWIAESEIDAYAQEVEFVEAHCTRKCDGGFNIADGGAGFTSKDAVLWNKTPEGRAAVTRGSILGADVHARRAGYPTRRVLAELEKGPRMYASLEASLGLTDTQVQSSFKILRRKGYHIIGEPGGRYRLPPPGGSGRCLGLRSLTDE